MEHKEEKKCENCGFSGQIDLSGTCWSSQCDGKYQNVVEPKDWKEERKYIIDTFKSLHPTSKIKIDNIVDVAYLAGLGVINETLASEIRTAKEEATNSGLTRSEWVRVQEAHKDAIRLAQEQILRDIYNMRENKEVTFSKNPSNPEYIEVYINRDTLSNYAQSKGIAIVTKENNG